MLAVSSRDLPSARVATERVGLALLFLVAFVPQVLAGGRAVYWGGYHFNRVLGSAPWHVYGVDGDLEGTPTLDAGGLATYQAGPSALSVRVFPDGQIPPGAQIHAVNAYFRLSRDGASVHQRVLPFTHYAGSGSPGDGPMRFSTAIPLEQIPVFPEFRWIWVPFPSPADGYLWRRDLLFEEVHMAGFGLWICNPGYPNEGGLYWSEFVLVVDWR